MAALEPAYLHTGKRVSLPVCWWCPGETEDVEHPFFSRQMFGDHRGQVSRILRGQVSRILDRIPVPGANQRIFYGGERLSLIKSAPQSVIHWQGSRTQEVLNFNGEVHLSRGRRGRKETVGNEWQEDG